MQLVKTSRDNLLRPLQIVSGIVERRHTLPILANLRNNDIKLIHMRHEQACAYAADASNAF